MKLHIFRISNQAAATDGKLPERLKLLAWGDNPGIKGLNPRLGKHTLANFSRRMQAEGFDRIALDFEHNTVPGTVHYEEAGGEPRPVAAFGVPQLIEGDGLYLDALSYTPHGREHALNYYDLSPTVHIDPATGEVDLLHSVALTRAGVVTGLSFYSIEANVGTQASGDGPESKQGDEGMDWKQFVIVFTGAAADASDEDLAQALTARLHALSAEAAQALAEQLTALSATVEGLKPGAGEGDELTALSTTVATLKDELTSVHGELTGVRRQAVVERATREGKVIPLSAEQLAQTDPAVLDEMVGKLAATVPLDQRTPTNLQPLSAGASTALKRVAETCGMDPAHVAEVNKAK